VLIVYLKFISSLTVPELLIVFVELSKENRDRYKDDVSKVDIYDATTPAFASLTLRLHCFRHVGAI
jgi:hypothetical protein